jgi:small subunit ribosomal protein S20
MPNHKSAEKRDRQNAKRNAINTAHRSRLRTAIKKLRAAIAAKNVADAQALLPQTVSIIDKSIQKGVIHRNAAARYKSRLTNYVTGLGAGK